ncbi:MAG: OmpH family outer membrane protein [Thermoguttaceae bacterium]|jgi:Skp family chaperone for outer membrane proteins
MRQFYLGFLLMLAMPLVANAQQAQSQAANAQTKTRALIIAVVDLPSLIKAHPVTTDEVPMLQEQFKKEALEAQKAQQDFQKQMESVTREYNIGTPQFEEAVRPIKEGMRQLEAQMQDKQAEMQNRLVPLQYKVYSDIQEAVKKVAYEKGVIIVHAKVTVDRTGMSEELAAVKEADANGTLVWNRPECDITEDVKATLVQVAGAAKRGSDSLNSLAAQAADAAKTPAPQRPAAGTQPRAANRASGSRLN